MVLFKNLLYFFSSVNGAHIVRYHMKSTMATSKKNIQAILKFRSR